MMVNVVWVLLMFTCSQSAVVYIDKQVNWQHSICVD